MRTADAILRLATLGAGLALMGIVPAGLTAPAFAFDGSKSDNVMAGGPPALKSMDEAFRSGAKWLKSGDKEKALHSLEYAAERGHAVAQWKLGRMYQAGDGVAQDDLKAFDYFRLRRASSPRPSWRSVTIISKAFRTPR